MRRTGHDHDSTNNHPRPVESGGCFVPYNRATAKSRKYMARSDRHAPSLPKWGDRVSSRAPPSSIAAPYTGPFPERSHGWQAPTLAVH